MRPALIYREKQKSTQIVNPEYSWLGSNYITEDIEEFVFYKPILFSNGLKTQINTEIMDYLS